MVQGRSIKIISMTEWIRISRLSIKRSLSLRGTDPMGDHAPGSLNENGNGQAASPGCLPCESKIAVVLQLDLVGFTVHP
jgi:hypothetical protein